MPAIWLYLALCQRAHCLLARALHKRLAHGPARSLAIQGRPGYAALVFVMSLIAMMCGCQESLDKKVACVAAQIPAESIENGRERVMETLDTDSLLVLRRDMRNYTPEQVVSAVNRNFAKAATPLERARAIGALRLCLYVETQTETEVLAAYRPVAKKALLDPDDRVALQGLELLELVPKAEQEEKGALLQRLGGANDGELIGSGYQLLGMWGESGAVLRHLWEPIPDKKESEAYHTWLLRTSIVVALCQDSKWLGRAIPEGLGDRLVDVIEKEPVFTDLAARTLIMLEARSVLPRIKNLLSLAQNSADRIALALTVSLLSFDEVGVRSQVPRLFAGNSGDTIPISDAGHRRRVSLRRSGPPHRKGRGRDDHALLLHRRRGRIRGKSAESLLARAGESYTLAEHISQAGATRGARSARFSGRRRP